MGALSRAAGERRGEPRQIDPQSPPDGANRFCSVRGALGAGWSWLRTRGRRARQGGSRAASKGRATSFTWHEPCSRGRDLGGSRAEQEARLSRSMDAAAGCRGFGGPPPRWGVWGDHPPRFAADNLVPLQSVTSGFSTSNMALQRNHKVIGGEAVGLLPYLRCSTDELTLADVSRGRAVQAFSVSERSETPPDATSHPRPRGDFFFPRGAKKAPAGRSEASPRGLFWSGGWVGVAEGSPAYAARSRGASTFLHFDRGHIQA